MLDEMKKFYKDREKAIPMIETWVTRHQDLRLMAIIAKHDVNKTLNQKANLKLVGKILECKGVAKPLENNIRELVKNFDDWGYSLLPDIVDENKNNKNLQQWKDQDTQLIATRVDLICK
jgi:hypothetical protein